MEPSIDIILNVMPAKAGIQTNRKFSSFVNCSRHSCGLSFIALAKKESRNLVRKPWIPDPVKHWSGMTERGDGMLG
jgi:homoserine trans-succinylase